MVNIKWANIILSEKEGIYQAFQFEFICKLGVFVWGRG